MSDSLFASTFFRYLNPPPPPSTERTPPKMLADRELELEQWYCQEKERLERDHGNVIDGFLLAARVENYIRDAERAEAKGSK